MTVVYVYPTRGSGCGASGSGCDTSQQVFAEGNHIKLNTSDVTSHPARSENLQSKGLGATPCPSRKLKPGGSALMKAGGG